MQVHISNNKQMPSRLLELPKPALKLVLQQLDQGSLASAAVTCSTLRNAVPGTISKVDVRCRTQETLDGLSKWLDRHSISLTDLSLCGFIHPIFDYSRESPRDWLRSLACPGLRQLQLRGLKLQLAPAGGDPGVLQACSGLEALHLQSCWLQDAAAASAAIAALPQLNSLTLESVENTQHVLSQLQHFSQLTCLNLDLHWLYHGYVDEAQLMQLSRSVGLRRLRLTGISSRCVQLVQPSSLTALQQLSISSENLSAADIPGIQHLPQLTGLALQSRALVVSNITTPSWSCMTALQQLDLQDCTVQAEAVQTLTQLQALSLLDCSTRGPLQDMLLAVSHMTLLTSLSFTVSTDFQLMSQYPDPPAAAFTALTASTKLCSLQLNLACEVPQDWVLFSPGRVYPHLQLLELHRDSRMVYISVPPSH